MLSSGIGPSVSRRCSYIHLAMSGCNTQYGGADGSGSVWSISICSSILPAVTQSSITLSTAYSLLCNAHRMKLHSVMHTMTALISRSPPSPCYFLGSSDPADHFQPAIPRG